jgi:hypothetical protein
VAVTAVDGKFVLLGVLSGPVTVKAELVGFASQRSEFMFHDQHPQQLDFVMAVGAISEAVTITTQTPKDRHAKIREPETMVQPSQNVVNLQRRAAGVLPVRVDVPRAGTSHHFVKPLMVDQETVLSLSTGAVSRDLTFPGGRSQSIGFS